MFLSKKTLKNKMAFENGLFVFAIHFFVVLVLILVEEFLNMWKNYKKISNFNSLFFCFSKYFIVV